MGIYMHVPFCARSCDFCHFYQEAPKREELEKYLCGMELALARNPPPRPAKTVFWGGGTPGLLPPAGLERLGRAILKANGGNPPDEWSVEMAPATVKRDRLQVLKDMGVTRISMGVQSFQQELLDELGRIHSLKQVYQAVELLHEMELSNFNLDLIFAIPGQSIGMWEADLKAALAARPAHISTYCLTFEEDTALWLRLQKGQVIKIDPDDEASYFERTWEILGEGGFEQYEISNYSRPGRSCRHNIDTWRMEEWLGYGPSASSQSGGRRWTEPHSIEEWLEGLQTGKPKYADEQVLNRDILVQDSLIFGLRMNAGVDLDTLQERFGRALPESWFDFQGSLVGEGLAILEGSTIRLSPNGRLVADRIAEEILDIL